MLDSAALRRQFPISQRMAYCNHAAVSPLATATRDAMQAQIADVNEYGAVHWRAWLAGLERARQTLARLLGATPAEIAFTKNTSEGLSFVAQGLDWQPGDRIVTFACEFPANLYPWLALRERGVLVELLPEAALTDLGQIERACRGARLLAVSFVQYLSGFRLDLEALGQICRRTGTLFLVDAIQGLGAFPVDVRRAGIHFLSADGHKWLTGPEGAGLFFAAAEVLEQLTPREIGWLSVEEWADFGASARAAAHPGARLGWRPGADRFECGTLNTAGLLGLGAAVELLLDTGIAAIAQHLLALGDRFGEQLRARGAELYRLAEGPGQRSGITSFRHPGRGADALVAALEADHIICINRQGWVRVAPHLYNTAAELDRIVAHLP